MVFYTYIIKSESDNRLFYGQTNNLLRRLNQHNQGLEESTRSDRPWVLLAYKEFDTRSGAMAYHRRLNELRTKSAVMKFIREHGFHKV
jgi:putative endonuclease